MPYIDKPTRAALDRGSAPRTAGELNYCFHIMLEQYLSVHVESYQVYNDMLGALDAAGKELYRRRIAPYEERKVTENGDILFYQQ